VERLFSEIGGGWCQVFGKDLCNLISVRMAKKFSGLDPRNQGDRRRFGSHLGILQSGTKRIEECMGDISKLDSLSDEEEEYGWEGTEVTPDRKRKKTSGMKANRWCEIKDSEVKTIIGERYTNRAKVYYRWSELGRALLTFPLITSKRGVYEDLNCILSHVILFF
jgi:hypothetical protein